MPEMQWYYARNDQQFGPVSAVALKQLADSGELSPDDLLWREGMAEWATAINLRGLFTADAMANTPTAEPSATLAQPAPPPVAPARTQPPAAAGPGVSLRPILRTTQFMLWSMCVLVVLVGVVLFTRAFLVADEPSEEAAAAAVFTTFFIGAYVLARSGEKLARLLLAAARRRR
ncbi:MAG: DUF4339 domain-containing protein [Pirellulales bacterium]